jgi:hypothetical protein
MYPFTGFTRLELTGPGLYPGQRHDASVHTPSASLDSRRRYSARSWITRARMALSALSVAEYFREEMKQDVLLFIDNIFRSV